ncbi:MAG: phage portal protein, partial [Oscillospiraceae bacterium]|nr:phage portal protein [Oscillospiraceae bacterium]
GNVLSEAWFTPDFTEYHVQGQSPYRVDNPASYPLLVPIINRPDARRPFGHSRISRSCMSLMQSASRTVKRSEISAEFYSFPQKYMVGLAEDATVKDTWAAAMSAMMTVSKDGDGDKPTVGQFSQQSMAPHMEQLRMLAALFAGETGLTLDDLGFVSDNPSSAEAIKASHETLRLMARKAQRDMSVGLLNTGYLAACLRDNFAYQRRQISQTRVIWEPIFEPDAAMLSGIGDGAIKINQAVPGYFGPNNLRALTGVEADQG